MIAQLITALLPHPAFMTIIMSLCGFTFSPIGGLLIKLDLSMRKEIRFIKLFPTDHITLFLAYFQICSLTLVIIFTGKDISFRGLIKCIPNEFSQSSCFLPLKNLKISMISRDCLVSPCFYSGD